jgi:sodium/potassium-transporting ATPase subunit alpha
MSREEEKSDIVPVEDTKITFAKVHRPERTKTIQTVDTSSRRPSISAPKKPKKKEEKKNIDIVSFFFLDFIYISL